MPENAITISIDRWASCECSYALQTVWTWDWNFRDDLMMSTVLILIVIFPFVFDGMHWAKHATHNRPAIATCHIEQLIASGAILSWSIIIVPVSFFVSNSNRKFMSWMSLLVNGWKKLGALKSMQFAPNKTNSCPVFEYISLFVHMHLFRRFHAVKMIAVVPNPLYKYKIFSIVVILPNVCVKPQPKKKQKRGKNPVRASRAPRRNR